MSIQIENFRLKPAHDAQTIVAPWRIALLLMLPVSILATLIPGEMYARYMHEQNFAFLDPETYGYMAACIVTFALTAMLAFRKIRSCGHMPILAPSNQTIALSVLNLTLISIRFYFAQADIGIGNVVNVLLHGYGMYLRSEMIASIGAGKIGWITDVCLALTVYTFWVFLSNPHRRYRWLVMTNVLAFATLNILTLARDMLMTGAIMISILYVANLRLRTPVGFLKMAFLGIGGLAAAVTLFNFIGTSREYTESADAVPRNLIGYFSASYSRLASVIHGDLQYPNSGWGFYSSEWMWEFPVVAQVFDTYSIGRDLGIDTPESANDNWKAQFHSVASSHLNPGYIWLTSFGFAFADFGWFGVLYFALNGLLAGYCYRLFIDRSIAGMLCYPFIAATEIKWFSTLTQSTRTWSIVLVVVCLVVSYNKWIYMCRLDRLLLAGRALPETPAPGSIVRSFPVQ